MKHLVEGVRYRIDTSLGVLGVLAQLRYSLAKNFYAQTHSCQAPHVRDVHP